MQRLARALRIHFPILHRRIGLKRVQKGADGACNLSMADRKPFVGLRWLRERRSCVQTAATPPNLIVGHGAQS